MIVCASMNVCLTVYVPPRGVEVCVLTVSGVQTLIPPPLHLSLHRPYENGAERQRKRKLFLNNTRTTCLFPRLKDPALNINNLSQVSVSHIRLMHAIVNNHTVSHDRLRKLDREQERLGKCVRGENGTTERALNRAGFVC